MICVFIARTATASRLKFRRLMSTIVDVPHRQPPMSHFIYLFNKYSYQMFETWYILSGFSSSKCSLFHNTNVFGFCIIHILYTGCSKIKKFRRRKVNNLKLCHHRCTRSILKSCSVYTSIYTYSHEHDNITIISVICRIFSNQIRTLFTVSES